MPLLLEADPDEAKVQAYCRTGQVWVMETDTICGVAVLQAVEEEPEPTAEIMNIAIKPGLQGKGMGKQLLNFLIAEAERQGVQRLQVATGNSSIGQLAFYQKAGFELLRLERHYFTKNYSAPIIENGIHCRHRLVLELLLP
ncbi:GNAT family N-acetyltransferase [Phaeodactylibacter xiamenensis]